MTFEELKRGVKELRREELRFDLADYLELVIGSNEESRLSSILETFFGGPRKAGGQPVTDEVMEEIEYFGGVRQDQTLYTLRREDEFIYAMAWPWSHQTCISVRLERVKLSS